MITEDQTEICAFLASPATHDGASVERIDTHTAVVFMAGSRAFKLKRAVRYDYLDFSTVDLRRGYCEAEVRLNRRSAPTLYRGAMPVTRQADGRLALNGDGTPVDWVVAMSRFPQECLFDRMAADHRLTLDLMQPLAAHIAAFHANAEQRYDYGGSEGMYWVADGNTTGLVEFGTFLDADTRAELASATHGHIQRHASLLDARRASGNVRHCHGDLHLGNIVLLDGAPTLFDGIEFNDAIACVDVLYDLAFLVMDLCHRDLPGHANLLLNRYLAHTGDIAGLALMPLFLSCRAAVRAKTSATAARMQTDPQIRTTLEQAATDYLAMAAHLLAPPLPRLIAVGGLSGSGKSSLALALAPTIGGVPGALVLRSDEIRKRLSNVAPLERLGSAGYTPAVSERVYQKLAEDAALALSAGQTVIVDAVFQDERERHRVEDIARQASVPFAGLWLEAPMATLIARVTHRTRDASDADATIVELQSARALGELTWTRLDASVALTRLSEAALEAINGPAPPR